MLRIIYVSLPVVMNEMCVTYVIADNLEQFTFMDTTFTVINHV